jgi:predicted NACHT family NTPase
MDIPKEVIIDILENLSDDELRLFLEHLVNNNDFAKESLYDYLPVNVVIDHIANKNIWHKHLPYIQENWHFIDKTKFAKAIGLKGPFKKTRLFLKILPFKLL